MLCLTILREKAVIVVTVLGRVHADEVATALVFQHRFNDNLFHFGRHCNETLDVVLLIESEKFLRHRINLLLKYVCGNFLSVLCISFLDDLTCHLTLEKVVGTSHA